MAMLEYDIDIAYVKKTGFDQQILHSHRYSRAVM